jgi:hypothetical protein
MARGDAKGDAPLELRRPDSGLPSIVLETPEPPHLFEGRFQRGQLGLPLEQPAHPIPGDQLVSSLSDGVAPRTGPARVCRCVAVGSCVPFGRPDVVA